MYDNKTNNILAVSNICWRMRAVLLIVYFIYCSTQMSWKIPIYDDYTPEILEISTFSQPGMPTVVTPEVLETTTINILVTPDTLETGRNESMIGEFGDQNAKSNDFMTFAFVWSIPVLFVIFCLWCLSIQVIYCCKVNVLQNTTHLNLYVEEKCFYHGIE